MHKRSFFAFAFLGCFLVACSPKSASLVSSSAPNYKLRSAYADSYKHRQTKFFSDSLFKLPGTSVDKHYGYSPDVPVMVGGADVGKGVFYEQCYLNALKGPLGEQVIWNRVGTCCAFSSPNGVINNTGLLDMYEITYIGLPKPVIIYINMYDYGEVLAPKGFSYVY